MKRTIFFIIALIAFGLTQGDVQARFHPASFSGLEPNHVSTIPDAVPQPANPESPEVNGTILRTLTYHELTANYTNLQSSRPIISGSGNRAVFTHYTYDPTRITHIMTINTDGTDAREVHSFPDSLYYLRMDITDDGSKVLCTDQRELYIVNADGSGKQKLIEFEYGRISALQFSGDGAKVFFRMFENGRTVISPGTYGAEMKRGIWVMDASGSNLRQIVGADQIAPLLGVPADQTPWFISDYDGLDVSSDGSRIVFVVGASHLFSVSLNGQGLVKLGSFVFVSAYISSDGQKIAYIAMPNPCCSTPLEVWISNADGSGQKKLAAESTPRPQGVTFPSLSEHIALNTDGSLVLLGDSGVLMDTITGKAVLMLSTSADIPDTVAGESLYEIRMNNTANRFVYCPYVAPNHWELGLVEVSPASLRNAPTITEPKIEPGFVITNYRSTTTLSARVTTNQTLSGVGGRVLKENLLDVAVCVGDRFAAQLVDNGTQGDATASDGIYTDNRLRAFDEQYATVGPRTVRVKAEVKTSDGKRHASAIDFEPFAVVSQAPLIEISPTTLDFGDVTINQFKDLTLTVRNIGSVSLTINSMTIDNARFTVQGTTAPLTINAGSTQTITVRFSPIATGQQRGTLTINSTDPARPTVTVALAGNGVSTGASATVTDHTMTGGPIPGACGKPTVKTSFLTTDTEAIQWTLASGLSVGDALRWEWVQPNGSTYRTFNYALTQVAQGQACFWDAIQIAGQTAASLPGNWQVRVYVKNALVLTESFTITQGSNACPAITGITPSTGIVGATVTITGTGFNGVTSVKFTNNVSATFTVVSDTQITATVPSGAATGAITISEPNCNTAQSPGTFTVTQPSGRIVRVVCGSATLGGTLTVPIELVSQGDENALGFSLTFDPSVLSNPQAAKGSDASGAAINTNSNQIAQGKFGIALALSTGQSFTAGVRQIAVVTFTVSATTTATSTTIGFGDAPILRRVSDANAQVLTATYQSDTCATIAILRGYEADVTPRPNGKNDGTVSINDWVMVGRFAAALDTPAAGSEFQRADCAPRNTKGDGIVAVDDWVQAGRYYAALDAVQTIGGPSAPSSFHAAELAFQNLSPAPTNSSVPVRVPRFGIRNQQRVLRAVSVTLVRGQTGTVSIEMDSLGNENAVGFSLNFDPTVLTYVSAATGSAASNAFLIINSSQVATGKLGLAVAQPAGEKFAAGTRQVATVRFTVAANANAAASTAISFGDQPIKRQIADVNAVTLTATYADGSMTLVNSVACVSAASFRAADIASEAIIAAFGVNMATATVQASTVPLPTQLAGTTVTVKDSLGVERLAPLFFVSASQINYQMPPGTAAGQTTITVRSGNGIVSLGVMPITLVAPSLFTANSSGLGVAAADVLRVKANGTGVYESSVRWDAALQQFVSVPIDLGPEGEQVYLLVYGTGLRFFSSLSAATVTLGGSAIPLQYIGPQGGYVGLDQINLGPIPRSFAGRGEMDFVLTLDGKIANTVRLNIR